MRGVMIDSHLCLAWEALLVDASRAFSVAAAGDPFALPAREQGERNKRSTCWELFTFIATDSRTKEETNIQLYAGRDHRIKQNERGCIHGISVQFAKSQLLISSYYYYYEIKEFTYNCCMLWKNSCWPDHTNVLLQMYRLLYRCRLKNRNLWNQTPHIFF